MSGTFQDRWNRGEAIETFTPAERAELRDQLRKEPGYTDPKAPHHAAYVHDVRQLYEADFPAVDE